MAAQRVSAQIFLDRLRSSAVSTSCLESIPGQISHHISSVEHEEQGPNAATWRFYNHRTLTIMVPPQRPRHYILVELFVNLGVFSSGIITTSHTELLLVVQIPRSYKQGVQTEKQHETRGPIVTQVR